MKPLKKILTLALAATTLSATAGGDIPQPQKSATVIFISGKKYYVHDENNSANVGDTVSIMGTRPLSATKRYRLVKIVQEAVII